MAGLRQLTREADPAAGGVPIKKRVEIVVGQLRIRNRSKLGNPPNPGKFCGRFGRLRRVGNQKLIKYELAKPLGLCYTTLV